MSESMARGPRIFCADFPLACARISGSIRVPSLKFEGANSLIHSPKQFFCSHAIAQAVGGDQLNFKPVFAAAAANVLAKSG